jgi:peptidoglycan hydrolase-like protein with peptidoglycan-binding domain
MSTRTRHTRRATLALWALLALLIPMVMGAPPTAAAASYSCTSSTPVSARPSLRYGDTGSCVIVLQKLLLAKGYNIGATYATGYFGSGTDNAVRRYQASYRSLPINGVVGTSTWSSMVLNNYAWYPVSSGPNTTSRVVLSFDDCPNSLTQFRAAVLGAKNLGIALVLFPTGNCLATGRFDAAYARANGHYVFNHTISHPDLTTLSYSGAYNQLGSPGVVTNYGRPPYGAYNTITVRNAYARRVMRIWTWNVDTNDWRGKTQSQVVWYVVTYARANNTVLMHMGWNGFNASAISQMKSGLASRGLYVCRNLGATTQYPAFRC